MLEWLRRLLLPPPCHHHWHWLFTAQAGTVVYRHCCYCGVVSATHVLAAGAHVRVAEHGAFVEYQTERDYVPIRPNVVPLPRRR